MECRETIVSRHFLIDNLEWIPRKHINCFYMKIIDV